MVGRPRNPESSVPVEVSLTPKTIKYLDTLRGKEGFGYSRQEIIRNFIWIEINRLIEAGRLNEIE